MKQDEKPAAPPQASEGETENAGKSSRGGVRPGSGRKPKAGGKETGPTRSIRLPQELDAKLRAIALRRKKTPEQILKLLAVETLKNYDEAIII